MPTEDPTRNSSHSRDLARAAAAPLWIGEVAAVAAHELGNSITALTFALDLLRERQSGEDELRDTDEMRSVLGQASGLVRLLARLASSGTPVVRLELGIVVAEAEPLLQRLANRQLLVTGLEVPVPVVAARSELERALVDLVLVIHRAAGADEPITLSVTAANPARVAVEAAVAAAPAVGLEPLDFASLPFAHALATEIGGTLGAERLASGALRIELALPSAIR